MGKWITKKKKTMFWGFLVAHLAGRAKMTTSIFACVNAHLIKEIDSIQEQIYYLPWQLKEPDVQRMIDLNHRNWHIVTLFYIIVNYIIDLVNFLNVWGECG